VKPVLSEVEASLTSTFGILLGVFFVIESGNPDWYFSMACHPEVRGISGCLIKMLVKNLNLANRITER
jgi:hypothetical protein